MAPLTKDAVEVPKSAGSAAAPPTAPPQQSSGQLRSDAVSLEIPMKIHGSRVTEVVRGMTPHTQPFEEETSTMIVFPQGAVVRMATAVNAGQMLVLTNSKTRQDAICRVVKVRTFSKTQSYVEIEFTHAQPGYWGVTFPGSTPAPAAAKPSTPAPAAAPPVSPAPAPPVNAAPKPKPVAPAPEISWAPARPAVPPASPAIPPAAPPANASHASESKTPATPPVSAPPASSRPAQPESAFISIGSHETVEVAATSTSRLFAKIAAESDKEEAKKPAAIESPQAPPSKPIHSLSMKELLGDDAEEQVSAAASAAAEAENAPADVSAPSTVVRSTFGSLTGGAILAAASAAAPAEDFGARLELGLGNTSAPAPREKNWLMIAAIITLVFAGAIAGIVYVRQHMGANASATAAKQTRQASSPQNIASVTPASGAPAAESPAPAETRTNVTSSESEHGRPSLNSSAPANLAAGERANSNGSASKASSEAPFVETPREPSASQPPATDVPANSEAPNTTQEQPKPSVTSDMMASTLIAHPITTQRAGDGTPESAPTIDPSAANGSSASEPTISISTDVPNLAAPEVKPEEPIRVGGQIKEPTLLNFRPPIYPLAAKTAHVEGDVVIDTQLDKAGNVVSTKVVSGPSMLREPALDALRHWKYAPSVLDGQPVAVQMMVTIKFRL